MQYTICTNHQFKQKSHSFLLTSTLICMNRYCNKSLITLCQKCKIQHRDHMNKILTLQDITFLIQRLLKSPFKQLSIYIDQAVDVMKKYKLIQQNKNKIEQITLELQKQVINVVQLTQELIHQYAVCKNTIKQLYDQTLTNIQSTGQSYQIFQKSKVSLLSNLDYNFQKDKFQYGNQLIRQNYQKRKKSFQKTKLYSEEIKDYNMKIIQIILNNDDSQEEQIDIVDKKKLYEILRKQLQTISNQNSSKTIDKYDKTIKKNNNQIIIAKQQKNSLIESIKDKKQSHRHDNKKQYKSIQVQTSSQWIQELQKSKKVLQTTIQRQKLNNIRTQNELKNKINQLSKKQSIFKEQIQKIDSKYKQIEKQNNQQLKNIFNKLNQNKDKQRKKQKLKEEKFQKLLEIANWNVLIDDQRIQ